MEAPSKERQTTVGFLDQILNGRPGEAELRAAFRKSVNRKPITEENLPHTTEGNITRVVRAESTQPQGRLSACGQYRCFDGCL
jgi:hypothetical protein